MKRYERSTCKTSAGTLPGFYSRKTFPGMLYSVCVWLCVCVCVCVCSPSVLNLKFVCCSSTNLCDHQLCSPNHRDPSSGKSQQTFFLCSQNTHTHSQKPSYFYLYEDVHRPNIFPAPWSTPTIQPEPNLHPKQVLALKQALGDVRTSQNVLTVLVEIFWYSWYAANKRTHTQSRLLCQCGN